MYVAVVSNRNSPPAVLLRESFRQDGKVRNRTIANLSHWPSDQIDSPRQVLEGDLGKTPALASSFDIVRSRPHGHVAALMAARILEPGSELATSRALREETCHSSLGEVLQLGAVNEDDLYAAMDWLVGRQAHIEAALAQRHLSEGTLVLYDLTSTYFEGHHCPLARSGYSRDERRANPQIVFGLLSSADGCPVAVEVFEGNTGDPKTVAAQVNKLRERFHLARIVLVGDRGMLTQKRIEEDLRPHAGLEWISALRTEQIQKLAAGGALQMSLFDEQDLAEVTHPDYPGERLIVCRNPLLAAERARKRRELMEAAEKKLKEIEAATKVEKYFRWQTTAAGLKWERNPERIERDAALDGIYALRTSVSAERLDRDQTVLAYKRLAAVERAFRCLKSVDLNVRADSSPAAGSRAGARAPRHAGQLRGVAHAPCPGAAAIRR